jgi:MoaA/NifB/PqqE/SkfB family radical SAM enzyme
MLDRIAAFFQGGRTEKLPGHINVEVSALCNLSCSMCGFQKYYAKKGLMDFGTFKKLEGAFRKVDSVLFGFNAETLLNPNAIEMLEFVKKTNPRCTVSILTNGSLMAPEISEQLVQHGLDVLSISIDGATKKTHEAIRRGSDFERLIQNIKALNDAKRRNKSDKPILSTNYVGMKDNIAELPEFIRLAKELGFSSVRMTNVEPYTSDVQDSVLYGANYSEEIARIMKESQDAAKLLGIELSYPEFVRDEGAVCEFLQPVITFEGDVIPCSQFSYERETLFHGKKVYHPVISFGNIKTAGFEDIWNSKQYRNFRRSVLDGKGHQFCNEACLLREKVLCPK